jgi:hypothetical protein
VDEGIWGGLPMYGANAPFAQATTGVVMKPKPNGAVPFVVVVVLLVTLDWSACIAAPAWITAA